MVAVDDTQVTRRSTSEQIRELGRELRASASNIAGRAPEVLTARAPAPIRNRRLASATPKVRSTLQASASRMELRDRKVAAAQARRPDGWQEESYSYFDDVPELKYSLRFQGNVMSKCRWFAAWRDPSNPESDPIPITDQRAKVSATIAARAQAEMARLKGPLGGISEISRELEVNLEIAGEAYLVGFAEREIIDEKTKEGTGEFQPEEWAIYSISECKWNGTAYVVSVEPGDKSPRTVKPDQDAVIRIWQRHPRWSMLPDCNMRGVLGECEALVLLSNLVKAEPKSLMNAGYVTLPYELDTGPANPTEPEDGAEAQTSRFVADIYEGATEAVLDPESAAAVAPIFLRGPGEYLKEEYVHQVEIKRTMTAVLDERIEKRVQRIARGMNLPVEVVMGHQSTTFSNAAQVKQDEFDEHFQPKCVLTADALSISFLVPNLLDDPAVSDTDVEGVCVWFDPVDMIRQVDPFDSADYGLEHGAISYAAWRRAKGWDEEDAADPLERLQAMVTNLARLDPGVSTAIIETFGVGLKIPTELPAAEAAPGAAAAANIDPLAASARVNDTKNPGYKLMMIDRELRARLVSAADRQMARILERAGNRLRGKVDGNVRAVVKGIRAEIVVQRLGPEQVLAAGFTDDTLIGADAWDDLEAQFMAWGGQAQSQAIDLVNDVVGLSTAQRDTLEVRQAGDLTEAWGWMKDQLHDLAVARLYQPDPLDPKIGEFDPTSKVPTGLVRQALARAGGATGLTVQGQNVFVTLANGKPIGGIATGEAVMGELTHGGALIEAYEWVYGPAYRKSPFEDHETLDGEHFADWEAEMLSGSPFDAYFYPGDHDGCSCDVAPVLIPADTLDE